MSDKCHFWVSRHHGTFQMLRTWERAGARQRANSSVRLFRNQLHFKGEKSQLVNILPLLSPRCSHTLGDTEGKEVGSAPGTGHPPGWGRGSGLAQVRQELVLLFPSVGGWELRPAHLLGRRSCPRSWHF